MAENFDVFLSHNSRDKPAVIALAKKLRAHGLKVWLDAWELRPGHPWQESLEQIIETAKAAAVLVGGDGLGPWEDVEMRACLNEFVKRKLPVVPVLLPGCPSQPKIALFLQAFTWVDMRDGREVEGFYRLIWGITGEKPTELEDQREEMSSEADPLTRIPPQSQADLQSRPFSQGEGLSAGEHAQSFSTVPAVSQMPDVIVPANRRRKKPKRRGLATPQTPDVIVPPSAGLDKPAQAAPPHIHGWPAEKVQELRRQAAQALGLPVVFRDRLKSGGEGPEMAVIPAGSFIMGSPEDEPGRVPNEGPQHQVVFARPFALGVYVVTFGEYDNYCRDTGIITFPNDAGWGRGQRPAINVYWPIARNYCRWLSEQTGRNYRLPSEAEWEYACRAGTTTPFFWGSTIDPGKANYDGGQAYNGGATGEVRGKTLPVGQFEPNAFGLFDMHGNVWEWCEDEWHGNYEGAPEDGNAWSVDWTGRLRVLRGGSWSVTPIILRSSGRGRGDVFVQNGAIGFRLARDL